MASCADCAGLDRGTDGGKPDLMLDYLVLEIADAHQTTAHRVSVWRMLRSLGLTHKMST